MRLSPWRRGTGPIPARKLNVLSVIKWAVFGMGYVHCVFSQCCFSLPQTEVSHPRVIGSSLKALVIYNPIILSVLEVQQLESFIVGIGSSCLVGFFLLLLFLCNLRDKNPGTFSFKGNALPLSYPAPWKCNDAVVSKECDTPE